MTTEATGPMPTTTLDDLQKTITFEEFKRVRMVVATILEASEIPKADKLVKLKVSLGDEERQIVAGIKMTYPPEKLVGMSIVVVTNLEPRTLRGEVSHGMLLAATGSDGNPILLECKVPPGSKVG